MSEKKMTSKKRGFAALPLEERRAIASLGGKAAHAKHRAYEFTSEEARVAGRKGGAAVSRDRAHMAEIGRIGGRALGKRRQAEARARREKEERSMDERALAMDEKARRGPDAAE
jgi:uncharacterized protein